MFRFGSIGLVNCSVNKSFLYIKRIICIFIYEIVIEYVNLSVLYNFCSKKSLSFFFFNFNTIENSCDKSIKWNRCGFYMQILFILNMFLLYMISIQMLMCTSYFHTLPLSQRVVFFYQPSNEHLSMMIIFIVYSNEDIKNNAFIWLCLLVRN